jgi:hypothetical protein
MAILTIGRDWGTSPSIVRITTDNTLAQITTTGYLAQPSIIADIESIQNGSFEWVEGDLVCINYADGEGFFTRDATDNAFVSEPDPGALSQTLQENRVFVGNASNVATGVAMSGDVAIVASGATTIQDDAITTAKILDDAVTEDKIADDAVTTDKILDDAVVAAKIADDAVTTAKILDANVTVAKLAVALQPSHVVKFAGQHTTTNDATNVITVTGALNTDLAFVQMVDNGTNSVTVVDAVMTADTLSVTFSGAPATDTVINYQVLRAIA